MCVCFDFILSYILNYLLLYLIYTRSRSRILYVSILDYYTRISYTYSEVCTDEFYYSRSTIIIVRRYDDEKKKQKENSFIFPKYQDFFVEISYMSVLFIKRERDVICLLICENEIRACYLVTSVRYRFARALPQNFPKEREKHTDFFNIGFRELYYYSLNTNVYNVKF